jgi:adenylate cyclase
MQPQEADRMDCSVLFADVAGSTALYERLGDERAFPLIGECLRTMAACTVEAGGRVVKTIGDAVMAVFPQADDAAGAALQMQARVEALGAREQVPLGLRIGFHHGPVVPQGEDVFGDTVNLASRLCDLASRGQIVAARPTAALLGGPAAATLRELYAVPVKGKAEEVELVELAWQQGRDSTMLIPSRRERAASAASTLELELGPSHLSIGPQRRKVTVGRDLECDFVVHDAGVSRAHAMIERRRERFVLIDHSANGTYVSFEGQPELRVQHEEITLVGRGWLCFGRPRAEASTMLAFRCAGGADAG